MPESIYKVFISSPRDLDDERAVCKTAIQEFNMEHAHRDGPYFLPVDWHDVGPTAANPQQKLNEVLTACDYCVLMLHKEWGEKPYPDSQYSCGTEEEFAVASEQNRRKPPQILDIAVFFKKAARNRAADIEKFKERIKPQYFYKEFLSDEFSREFRALLARWRDELRDQERFREAFRNDEWQRARPILRRALQIRDLRLNLRAEVEEELGHVSRAEAEANEELGNVSRAREDWSKAAKWYKLARQDWSKAAKWYELALAHYRMLKDEERVFRVSHFLSIAIASKQSDQAANEQ